MKLSEPLAAQVRLAPNEALAQLVRRVAALVGAERCTIFLYDHELGDLVSRARTGLGSLEIRVSTSSGLAGACFSGAGPINVPDVYNDRRFNPEVDARMGFRTRGVLCCPIVNAGGGTIGVLQAINKSAGVFTGPDGELLQVFADKAAVLLETAAGESSGRPPTAQAEELATNHARLQSDFHELNARQEGLRADLRRLRLVARLGWGLAVTLVGTTLLALRR